MRIINYKETVEAPVSLVFDWFMNLDENYIKWYPDSHKDFKWLSPKPIIKGSVFKLEEEFDGHVHQMIMKITEFQKDKRLSFASEHIAVRSSILPSRLITILVKIFQVKMEMQRTFDATSDCSTTIHTKHIFGSPIPLVGWVVEWVAEHFLISKKSHLDHMKEEALNMKRELESTMTFCIH